MALTVLIFNNKISFLASGADWAVDDNYDRLSYGLCVFCRPSECQTEFDEYLLHKSDLQKQKEDLNLSSVLKWPNLTNFTSVNEYAHAGVSKDQCLVTSFLVLIPFVYLILWQVHFIGVVRNVYKTNKVNDE